MVGLLRWTGLLLIVVGIVVAGTWFIEPLQQLWPMFFQLPLIVRVGVVIAAIGAVVLLASLIHERVNDRADDDRLKNEMGDY